MLANSTVTVTVIVTSLLLCIICTACFTPYTLLTKAHCVDTVN